MAVILKPPEVFKMSIRYLKHVLEDPDYYINNCYDYESLLKVNKDIESAKREISELEKLIYNQIQQAVKVVKYREIIVRRHRQYRGNIEITVYINEYQTIDGERLKKNDMVYSTHKKFKGNEKKQAIAYANELKEKYHHPIVYDNWK